MSTSSHTPASNSESWLADFLATPTPQDPALTRMISIGSINAVAAIDGVSGPLGSPSDQALLATHRMWADAVIVTARTTHLEQYSQPTSAAHRDALGRPASPVIVAVSGSLNLELEDPLWQPTAAFSSGKFAGLPKIFLATTPASAQQHPEVIAELQSRGIGILQCAAFDNDAGAVGLADLVAQLHQLGLYRISVEGGPGLYSGCLQQQVAQELIYTLAPHIVLPNEPGVFASLPEFQEHYRLELLAHHVEDSMVYLRYRLTE